MHDRGLAASACQPVSGSAVAKEPSRGRKFAFWLLVGMISVVFVEVPAGSTMFPFFTVWGLLVVIPLYLLHSVFLAGVVFRFGRPVFWCLFAAGMLYGMYEGYITKVLWTSFRAEGPFLTVAGIAFFETILLVFFLHPILAFVVPLYFTEIFCTSSSEIEQGLPARWRALLSRWPGLSIGLLMGFLGFMQFVNSPSPAKSFISGAGNSLVLSFALYWWRRSGGAIYPMRDLLPGPQGMKIFAALLLLWYVFWGFAIKPKSIPGILHGQLTIWILYAILLVMFVFSLKRSKELRSEEGVAYQDIFRFSWRGFVLACALVTTVTTLCRLLLFQFAPVQILLFFSFYVIAGLLLFAGTLRFIVLKKNDKIIMTKS